MPYGVQGGGVSAARVLLTLESHRNEALCVLVWSDSEISTVGGLERAFVEQ